MGLGPRGPLLAPVGAGPLLIINAVHALALALSEAFAARLAETLPVAPAAIKALAFTFARLCVFASSLARALVLLRPLPKQFSQVGAPGLPAMPGGVGHNL